MHIACSNLHNPPDDCAGIPCSNEWEFDLAGRLGLNHVTWHELVKHRIVVRGPKLTSDDILIDDAALRQLTHDNLRRYWQAQLDRLPSAESVLASGNGDWLIQWFVPGTVRLHHLLATNTLTSKSGAGAYAQTAFDQRWRPIVEEALRLRDGSVSTSPFGDDRLNAVTEAIAFSRMFCEEGLRIPV